MERSEAVVGDPSHRHRLAVVEGSEESAEVGAERRGTWRGCAAPPPSRRGRARARRAGDDDRGRARPRMRRTRPSPSPSPTRSSVGAARGGATRRLGRLARLGILPLLLVLAPPLVLPAALLAVLLAILRLFLGRAAAAPRLGIARRLARATRLRLLLAERLALVLEVHTIQLSHVAQRRAELRVVRRHADPRTLE